jgi:hypothetical protein
MRLAISFFRKRAINDVRTKLRIATFLTLLVSSYLYIDYSAKIINNRIINGHLREQIATKVHSDEGNRTIGSNLTIQEYQQISEITWFPKLPDDAANINYSYWYDGFLPDYIFELTYLLPKEAKVESFDIRQGDFTKTQTVNVIGDKIKVVYTVGEQ